MRAPPLSEHIIASTRKAQLVAGTEGPQSCFILVPGDYLLVILRSNSRCLTRAFGTKSSSRVGFGTDCQHDLSSLLAGVSTVEALYHIAMPWYGS